MGFTYMKRIAFLFAAALSVVSFLGCGAGSINGTVSGISLAVQDSIFFTAKSADGKTLGVITLMADKPNICDTLKANRQPKSATVLAFTLLNVKVENGRGTQLAPDVGSYTVVDTYSQSGNYVSASFSRTDANCTASLTEAASSGRSGIVKITKLDSSPSGNLAGTFDVSIGTQADKLTGTINARYCDITAIKDNPSCE